MPDHVGRFIQLLRAELLAFAQGFTEGPDVQALMRAFDRRNSNAEQQLTDELRKGNN